MSTENGHIIAIRFSALGDVAMTIPVIKQWLDAYPDKKLVMVSRKAHAPLYAGIDRVIFYGADLKKKHKGIFGMHRLFRELHQQFPDAVIADLHGVLRSQILNFFFRLHGHNVESINKGRYEKKRIIRRHNKVMDKIQTSFERYASVFSKLGFPFSLHGTEMQVKQVKSTDAFIQQLPHAITIGIAPFAKHAEKMYPIERMRILLEMLHKIPINILLFGGGQEEVRVLQKWSDELGQPVHNLAGRFTMVEELGIIAQLDLMVSMDSANMHLASNYGVPVISIWGPTHPATGFYGWGQHPDHLISLPLECRPCSVYGNKPCWRGDHACMNGISVDIIYSRIMDLLSTKLPSN
jgi:ADP-heptose:LPS heptosyltransferase